MMHNQRPAAVAGKFYPGSAHELFTWIKNACKPWPSEKNKVKAVILPHAGYVFSGACALRALERIIMPKRVVIVGLNHRYHHEKLVVDDHDSWATPLGPVMVDRAWIEKLAAQEDVFMRDNRLGLAEHSLEVMVPLLRFFREDVSIVPVIVGDGDSQMLMNAAKILAELLGKDPDTLLLASTDMSHFITAQAAAKVDLLAIERICQLDALGLIETVTRQRISMCGVFSTALVLETVRQIGGRHGEVVCYTHSGETSGDDSSVVAYLSAILN